MTRTAAEVQGRKGELKHCSPAGLIVYVQERTDKAMRLLESDECFREEVLVILNEMAAVVAHSFMHQRSEGVAAQPSIYDEDMLSELYEQQQTQASAKHDTEEVYTAYATHTAAIDAERSRQPTLAATDKHRFRDKRVYFEAHPPQQDKEKKGQGEEENGQRVAVAGRGVAAAAMATIPDAVFAAENRAARLGIAAKITRGTFNIGHSGNTNRDKNGSARRKLNPHTEKKQRH